MVPAPTAAAWCQTTLNYARGDDQVAVPVTIHDGRTAEGLDPDGCGFQLVQHHSAVTHWRDQEHLRQVHRPEIADLARHLLGCDQALVYSPLVRSPATAAAVADYAPIEFVHSDFTEDYRPMVEDPDRPYRDFVEPLLAEHGLTQADIGKATRVVMLQFWRNIGVRHPDRPLAFCDARTVPRSQLGTFVVPSYGGQHLEFETFYANAPADPADNHWYGYPGLGRDEVVAFRTYDSACAAAGEPFWTLHSAFVDPTAGANAPRRESLEMRAMCLWGV